MVKITENVPVKKNPDKAYNLSKFDVGYDPEDDHRTLSRADEIRLNPKRMSGVRQFQQKKLKQLTRLGRSLRRR
jgi:hypothetical protein